MSRNTSESRSKTQKITLIALGAIVIVTVFLLPQFVTEPWLAPDDQPLPEIPQGSPQNVLPSTAAELKRYRQESQNLLADIVTMRERLTASNVGLWAEVEFKQAEDLIASGDEHYSFGEYDVSLDRFQQAHTRLTGLEALGRQKLAEAKASTEAAIESLNSNVANSQIELARAIAAEDPEVQALSARVAALAALTEHIEAGDRALELDKYAKAREEYRAAVALDPDHQRAANSLSRANRAVTDSDFRNHMSRGFAALERGDYDSAQSSFQSAGRIYPGNDAVSKALAQVENRKSISIVSVDLQRASDLESREEWQQAVDLYEALLADDPSLTDARVKLIPARVRADLDARLSGYIKEPLVLSNKTEFDAAQQSLQDARGINDPGPRLSGQILELDRLLRVANSPVDVVFRSDNQTHVVLFRVADLGQFEQRSVKLRPGRYVVSGTRNGYRDVRVEFTITGEPLERPIEVRCEEPIG